MQKWICFKTKKGGAELPRGIVSVSLFLSYKELLHQLIGSTLKSEIIDAFT